MEAELAVQLERALGLDVQIGALVFIDFPVRAGQWRQQIQGVTATTQNDDNQRILLDCLDYGLCPSRCRH